MQNSTTLENIMAGLGNIFKVKQSPTMVTAMSQLDVTQKQ
jgi:hypothetical protein